MTSRPQSRGSSGRSSSPEPNSLHKHPIYTTDSDLALSIPSQPNTVIIAPPKYNVTDDPHSCHPQCRCGADPAFASNQMPVNQYAYRYDPSVPLDTLKNEPRVVDCPCCVMRDMTKVAYANGPMTQSVARPILVISPCQ